MTGIEDALSDLPLVAILRGVTPEEAVPISTALYDAGFRCIEVPLNSPEPFQSIAAMTEALPDDCVTGAGTVLDAEDVLKVKQAGGTIIVTPNTDVSVIKASIDEDMIVVPGVGTATEAILAARAGARYLKMFPAATYGTSHVRALLSVLPAGCQILVTGGVSASNIADWKMAGAAGFGIGSELYRAGDSVEKVSAKALEIVASLKG